MTLPALVLVHGGEHSADCWDLTVAELAGQEPELRVLASQAGVKGTSGMRKNELIAAIRESRQGHTNGTPSNGSADAESGTHDVKAATGHADDAPHVESSAG